eukprot:TRINITY_DN2112_c0_g1_i3.p1 TRINITY_DN2112_c0_g1~~TRINITY_DN2112_c0_g1_i3.p1  ORF type:complete len:559 (-),score=100.95 TRINITY_DN2112_c0_g1_i3:222-1898(-)
MAFTSRAARNLNLTGKATSDNVGPGSYNQGRQKQVTGYAPFGAFSERKLGKAGVLASNPGPGSYDAVGYATQLNAEAKTAVSSQPFVSKAPRVAKQTAGSSVYKESSIKENPGPGSYSAHKQWIPKKTARPEHHALSIRHTQSAPSIPANHQSYGYEEDALGELQLQAPPTKGFSGRRGAAWDGSADDTAGPGEYKPSASLSKSASVRVSFGNSKSSRSCSMFEGKMGPGAGSYDPMLVTGASSKKGSSNFKTKTKRMQYMRDSKKTPGPGSYGYQDSFTKASMPLEESIQFFGSTQKRWYDVDEAASYMSKFNTKTPGPGAYKVGDEMKKGQGKQRASFLKAGEVGFSSTTTRAMGTDGKSNVPGPGAYSGDNTRGEFVQKLEKKLRSRTGAFGSSDDRFHNNAVDDKEQAGDSAPEEEKGSQRKNEPQKFPKQSSFLSHTDRFVEPEKEVPAPGAYEVQEDWISKKTTIASNKSFASSAARFNPREVFSGCPLKEVPAPGDYDKVQMEAPKWSVHKNSLSTDKRFKTVSEVKEPGPGSYRVQEGFIKRSFNVSIDI